jgi:hypothetical protein
MLPFDCARKLKAARRRCKRKLRTGRTLSHHRRELKADTGPLSSRDSSKPPAPFSFPLPLPLPHIETCATSSKTIMASMHQKTYYQAVTSVFMQDGSTNTHGRSCLLAAAGSSKPNANSNSKLESLSDRSRLLRSGVGPAKKVKSCPR